MTGQRQAVQAERCPFLQRKVQGMTSIKSWYLRLSTAILVLAAGQRVLAQPANFTLTEPASRRLELDAVFTTEQEAIDVRALGAVGGLAISGAVTLDLPSSYVRIILEDERGTEYQVFESNTLLDYTSPVALDMYCEETCSLGNVGVSRLRVELEGAQVNLDVVFASEAVTGRSELDRVKVRAVAERAMQLQDKIQRVQASIAAYGYKWVAGETAVARLTYEEKKQHACGPLNNLFGFEYYLGGIFEIPQLSDACEEPTDGRESPYVAEFSWRDRHGEDWLTPVKNQGGCGSCWAFAATGATELLTNLYFNQHLDLDLAEQDGLSCSGAGSCAGGWPETTLRYYASEGVVDEGCFPYAARDLMCTEKCTEPKQRIQISGVTPFSGSQGEDGLKALLLRGAVSGGIYWWSHAMTLVGYKVLDVGDQIFYNSESGGGYITIEAGDPLVGRTAWHFKNSWGPQWGDSGYVYVVTDISNIGWTAGLEGPVSATQLSDRDIRCEDRDGDGFYNWGVGAKPKTCPPTISDVPDGDDDDRCLGPQNEYGFLAALCQADEIDLGPIAHPKGIIVDGQAPLQISRWPFWWKHHAPDVIYVHFRAWRKHTLDNLSVVVGDQSTDLRGHHQIVPVAISYPEPVHFTLIAKKKQKVLVSWRALPSDTCEETTH